MIFCLCCVTNFLKRTNRLLELLFSELYCVTQHSNLPANTVNNFILRLRLIFLKGVACLGGKSFNIENNRVVLMYRVKRDGQKTNILAELPMMKCDLRDC